MLLTQFICCINKRVPCYFYLQLYMLDAALLYVGV